MGMFTVQVGVGHPAGGDLAPVDAIVDAGAAHSMLPESLLTRMAIPPLEQQEFIMADGRPVHYGFGMARFRLDDRERPCPVIFGPEGNYLLGASTLEFFNLVVDPAGEQLLPARLIRLGWGGAI